MLFRRKTALKITLGVWLACHAGQIAQADDLKAAFQAQAGWALHLLETGRYGEAEDAAQSLIAAYPDTALPYELRGATALYVGSVSRAQKDFSQADTLAHDPETQYGLALCALFGRTWDTAATRFSQAAALPGLTETQASDLGTAQVYVQFLKGDLTDAAAKPELAEDALREEIAAVMSSHTDPKAGAAQLTKFLATPDGVPQLREQDGMRPLFDPQNPIEPCVVEPDLQQMYADRLAGSLTVLSKTSRDVIACSGTATLTPTEAIPTRAALVAFSVDGQMAALVSQFPYEFSWNTAHVSNGMHQIRIDAVDASGNALTTQTLTVRVSNKNTFSEGNETDPAEAPIQARLWNLLKLRPCRKVAEWTLAQDALARGDRISAEAHLANAAALDPTYKKGQQFARALFAAPASAYWIGNTTRREIALTFDDGPNALKTPALLDALDKARAPATFFVVGSRAELVPDILHRMAARGDEVENHSYTHPNMNLVIPSVAEGEILRTSVLIRALTGHSPHFFRPPGGNADPTVQKIAHSYGLSLGYWTVDALHAEDLGSPQGLVEYVVGHVHPGSIVLLHNAPDVTVAAIPALVEALQAKGYTLVTLAKITQGKTSGKPTALPKMRE